jgi:hypothetical protein
VRAIKVTYRAVFQQPIGKLNPMGLKIPGEIPVELFGGPTRWQARPIDRIANAFTRLGTFGAPSEGQSILEQAFAHRLTEWQMWGTPPSEKEERILQPDEVVIGTAPFRVSFKQAEDYTHIIHAQTIPPGARIPPAACGAQVNAKCFISTKANVEPSCRECAEVWRREYKGK